MYKTKFSKLLLAGLVGAVALPAQTGPARQPLARAGEEIIYEEDLLPSIGAQLYQLRSQEYDVKITALTNLVNQRVLDAEAKSQGVSTEVLLEKNADRNVATPTPGEIEAYYLAQKDRINKPLAEVRSQVEQALLQARRQAARQTWLAELRKKAGFVSLLPRPTVEVMVDASRLKGDTGAPITIVEFADFQCPYCMSVQDILKQVLNKYNGKVRLGFRDFPLRQIHPQAQAAAEASRCAADQGKFWEYHDVLYSHQTNLDPANLKNYARIIGLDEVKFDACIASGKFKPMIDADLKSGAIAGVSGTPAFVINGVLLNGTQTAATFESIIDGELARSTSTEPEKTQ